MNKTRTTAGAGMAVFREGSLGGNLRLATAKGRWVALNDGAMDKSVRYCVAEPEGDRGIPAVRWVRGGGGKAWEESALHL